MNKLVKLGLVVVGVKVGMKYGKEITKELYVVQKGVEKKVNEYMEFREEQLKNYNK